MLATYDGSGKAAGVKIYIDGQPQATDVAADALRNTIRTTAPFTTGQRHIGEGARGAMILGLRIYDRVLDAGRGRTARLGRTGREPGRTAAGKRPRPSSTRPSRGGCDRLTRPAS